MERLGSHPQANELVFNTFQCARSRLRGGKTAAKWQRESTEQGDPWADLPQVDSNLSPSPGLGLGARTTQVAQVKLQVQMHFQSPLNPDGPSPDVAPAQW